MCHDVLMIIVSIFEQWFKSCDFPVIGVAVGSGWQAMVAYVNLGCYYIVGLPLGFLMGWVFDLGVMVSLASKVDCLPFLLVFAFMC